MVTLLAGETVGGAGEGLGLGLALAEGETEALPPIAWEGLTEALGLKLAEGDGDVEAEGDSDALGKETRFHPLMD